MSHTYEVTFTRQATPAKEEITTIKTPEPMLKDDHIIVCGTVVNVDYRTFNPCTGDRYLFCSEVVG